MIDSDLVAKEILPYLQQDVCPVLVEDISEKSDRMIWIVSKAMQEKLNIEGAIVYEEFLEEMVEYSCNMFTCNWDYFYLNNFLTPLDDYISKRGKKCRNFNFRKFIC